MATTRLQNLITVSCENDLKINCNDVIDNISKTSRRRKSNALNEKTFTHNNICIFYRVPKI